MSSLYEKDTYLNKNIEKLMNHTIIEYDLKSANTSLCKEYKLLPEDVIKDLEDKPKNKRVVAIGKMQIKNKELKDGLKYAFIDIRRRFFEENELEDSDILSIKKDAIFCLKQVEYTEFGKCKFVEKNRYTSYLYLNKCEFYYNSKGKLDIKNISDDMLEKHELYFIQFFKTLFKHMETSSEKTLYRYLTRFINKYKMLELEVGYYREFNQSSRFILINHDETYDDEMFIPYEHKQNMIDIDYNFFYILLPLVKILM